MDNDAIRTSHDYSKILDQHVSGGYFSDAVKEAFEAVKDLSDEEKRAFFVEQFNKLFSRAQKLQNRVGADSVDLSEQGLGVIKFETESMTAEEVGEEGSVGFRSLRVEAESFASHAQEIEGGPRLWKRADGQLALDDDDYIQDADDEHIDQALLHILDFKETLDVAIQTLQARSRSATGQSAILSAAAYWDIDYGSLPNNEP